VASAWEPLRAFATAPGEPDVEARVSFGAADLATNDGLGLQIISANGWYRRFAVDEASGGECALLEQYNLAEHTEWTSP